MSRLILTSEQEKDLLNWAETLETTELGQYQNALCNHAGTSFCCIGIYGKMQKMEWVEVIDGHGCEIRNNDIKEVYNAIERFDSKFADACIALNDDRNCSFTEIARYIRMCVSAKRVLSVPEFMQDEPEPQYED